MTLIGLILPFVMNVTVTYYKMLHNVLFDFAEALQYFRIIEANKNIIAKINKINENIFEIFTESQKGIIKIQIIILSWE